jgi:hypothetical protein
MTVIPSSPEANDEQELRTEVSSLELKSEVNMIALGLGSSIIGRSYGQTSCCEGSYREKLCSKKKENIPR